MSLTASQIEALELLRDYTPEVVPSLVAPDCAECGWPQPYHSDNPPYGMDVGANDHGFIAGPPSDTPFFTESFLYPLMGKEEARSILATIRNVLRAFDIDEMTIRDYV